MAYANHLALAVGKFLDEEKGIKNVSLTSSNAIRVRGTNRYLEAFLKPRRKNPVLETGKQVSDDAESEAEEEIAKPEHDPSFVDLATTTKEDRELPAFSRSPHVLITTSLLSRGLDFSKDVRHVFILDEPRNMIDFLHRYISPYLFSFRT